MKSLSWMLATAPGTDLSWIRDASPVSVPAGGFPIGAVALAVVVASGVAFLLVWAIGRDRARHGPAVRGLARGLGLGFAECRLLARIAAHSGLSSAGSLLVSRACFEASARRWGGDAARVDAIRRAVFMR